MLKHLLNSHLLYSFFFILTGLLVFPQINIGIGDGNDETTPLPFDPFYDYSYSQSIYLYSEINRPESEITSIKWYYSGNSTLLHSKNISVYIGHTDKTNFINSTDWIPFEELTQVFSGNIEASSAGWVVVNLDQPFLYNGTANLVIAVDENTEGNDGINSSTDDFYNTPVSENRSIFYRNFDINPDPGSPPSNPDEDGELQDAIAYIPNIQLTFLDETIEDTYCPINVLFTAEPITKVELSGLNNISSPNSTQGYESFTHLSATLTKSYTYDLKVKGNTRGNYNNYFTVFIDWNNNGVLGEEGEYYYIGSISNSTGTDDQEIIFPITIPEEALEGGIRMRVLKTTNNAQSGLNPCSNLFFGQIEDYTLLINPKPAPYCSPLEFEEVSPITFVLFSGIENTTDASTSEAHEIFDDVYATVRKGKAYEISIKANTNGDNTYRVVAFFDWNQNGFLADSDEVYELGTISNSTGEDDILLEGVINIPEDVVYGQTGMRIKLIPEDAEYPTDPCAWEYSGQAEDYRINVWDDFENGECEYIFQSPNFIDALGDVNNFQLAADFVIPQGANMTINKIIPNLSSVSTIETVSVYLYSSHWVFDRYMPLELLYAFPNIVPASQTYLETNYGYDNYRVEIDLPEPVQLSGGDQEGGTLYWVAIQTTSSDGVSYVFLEVYYDYGGTEGLQYYSYVTEIWYIYGGPWRAVMDIIGECEDEIPSLIVEETEDYSMHDITLYPNPTQGRIHIQSPDIHIKETRIYDFNGKLLNTKQNPDQIDISHLPPGVYIVIVTDANHKNYSYKIIKK